MEGRPIALRFAVRGLRGLPVQRPGARRRRPLAARSTARSTCVDRSAGRARARPDAAAAARRPRPVLALTPSAARPESLLVLPEPAPPPAGLRRGGAEVSGDPEPDGLRPYAPGTPMSRVHWPSAARGRRLAGAPLRQRPRSAPAGRGRHVERGASSTRIARDAAGIVLALARTGGCRVLLPGDRVPTTLDDTAGWPALHRRLADARAGRPRGARRAIRLVVRVADAERRRARRAAARRRGAGGVGGVINRGAAFLLLAVAAIVGWWGVLGPPLLWALPMAASARASSSPAGCVPRRAWPRSRSGSRSRCCSPGCRSHALRPRALGRAAALARRRPELVRHRGRRAAVRRALGAGRGAARARRRLDVRGAADHAAARCCRWPGCWC